MIQKKYSSKSQSAVERDKTKRKIAPAQPITIAFSRIQQT